MQQEITIFLTPNDAELFKSYQQFHQTFALLCSKGVFDTKYGKVILNFANGEIQNITKEEVIYHK